MDYLEKEHGIILNKHYFISCEQSDYWAHPVINPKIKEDNVIISVIDKSSLAHESVGICHSSVTP